MSTYNESGTTEAEQEERKTVVNDDLKEDPLIRPLMEIKTMVDLLEELEEEQRKLKEEIDNQPVTNLNSISRKRKKEKLPRKLRNGW